MWDLPTESIEPDDGPADRQARRDEGARAIDAWLGEQAHHGGDEILPGDLTAACPSCGGPGELEPGHESWRCLVCGRTWADSLQAAYDLDLDPDDE